MAQELQEQVAAQRLQMFNQEMLEQQTQVVAVVQS
jgi:hypothetical protein